MRLIIGCDTLAPGIEAIARRRGAGTIVVMQDLAQFLSQPAVNALGGFLYFLLGVLITFAVSYGFYRASMLGPRPTYQVQSLQIIGEERRLFPAGLQITFNQKPVRRLTKTYIVFWNSGAKTLFGNDIASEHGIQFRFGKPTEILDVSMAKMTRPENLVSVGTSDSESSILSCTFNYLDPGDGVAIEVLHSGPPIYPAASAVIRGVPKGIEFAGDTLESTSIRGALGWILGLTAAAFATGYGALLLLTSSVSAGAPILVGASILAGLLVALLAVILTVGTILVLWDVARGRKRKHPQALRVGDLRGITLYARHRMPTFEADDVSL